MNLENDMVQADQNQVYQPDIDGIEMVIVAENDTGSQQSTGGELGKSSLRKRH
jgi:hypothetical protein